MLVVAGIAYTVDTDSEEEAEDILLHFLDRTLHSDDQCHILKLWVSARQGEATRIQDLKDKEQEALG